MQIKGLPVAGCGELLKTLAGSRSMTASCRPPQSRNSTEGGRSFQSLHRNRNRKRAPSLAEKPTSSTGKSLEKRVQPRDSKSSGRNFATSSSNRARDAASCIATGPVIRTPIDLHPACKRVIAIRSRDIDLPTADHGNPARRIRDVEVVIGLLEYFVNGLMLRNPVKTSLRVDARSGNHPDLNKFLVVLFHSLTPFHHT